MEDIVAQLRSCLTSEDLEARISAGIRDHRTRLIRLSIQGPDGRPVPRQCRVAIRHVGHTFSFGANSFMLDGYADAEQNSQWEQAYQRLFNHTVVPFYWADLEPEDGRSRFGSDSLAVYRRPAPDRVLDWCRREGITPKGHPLIWHQLLPSWLPTDAKQRTDRIRRRFEEIAARYHASINTWDVVNEALIRPPELLLPRDYVYWAFEQAAELFPSSNRLFYNDVGWECFEEFHQEDSALYLLLQNLQLRQARLDGIGMQHHLFMSAESLARKRDQHLSPRRHLDVLDRYADFALPVHISEITIPQYPGLDDDGSLQADMVRASYRAWFSHPSVEAIVWWNLADGRQFGDEAKYRGGLLREDLSEKPAYRALDDLINREWRTTTALTGAEGRFELRAFHGRYEVSIDGQPHAREIVVDRDGPGEIVLTVSDSSASWQGARA